LMTNKLVAHWATQPRIFICRLRAGNAAAAESSIVGSNVLIICFITRRTFRRRRRAAQVFVDAHCVTKNTVVAATFTFGALMCCSDTINTRISAVIEVVDANVPVVACAISALAAKLTRSAALRAAVTERITFTHFDAFIRTFDARVVRVTPEIRTSIATERPFTPMKN